MMSLPQSWNQQVRELFPITKECIYLNHAGTGPLTLPAENAIKECIEVHKTKGEFDIETYFNRLKTAREYIAKLIDADVEEITFTHNTSEGIYIALINLPLNEGDRIIVMEEAFPAIRYIVDYNLPEIEKKYVRLCGKDPIEVIKKNINSKTRAVAIDYVHFFTGEMIDIYSLNEFLKEKEIFFIVDGIQAIGSIDFSVKKVDIDFLACGAAKWLFGPCGAGFLYVNKRNFKKLKHLHTGWLGAEWQNFENFGVLPPLYPDARMFEQGTRNVIGISALGANCKMLKGIGLLNVANLIQNFKKQLRQGFLEKNIEIITPDGGLQSGIITIKPKEPKKIFRKFLKNKVIISFRNDCLRFSPHFYNSEEEIEEVLCLI